ncbi:MAG TPA: site-2 protease family protein [Terriglobales bacterium]|nr:site-2 protease family protein [Terriglobales bacterium]
MSSQQLVEILFQIIAFLFAISVHESAHAWTANRCGDPTARMLGRITLNPIKHIDPVGTILLPAIAMISHFPVIGWAKPTPVDPRHFKNPVRDDILVSVAGPVSNLIVASAAVLGLAIIALTSPLGRALVHGFAPETNSILMPITLLLYEFMYINVLLAAFNIIPIPPLDGSHVLRHLLPDGARRIYDTMGVLGLLLLFLVGGPIIRFLMAPILRFFASVLARL